MKGIEKLPVESSLSHDLQNLFFSIEKLDVGHIGLEQSSRGIYHLLQTGHEVWRPPQTSADLVQTSQPRELDFQVGLALTQSPLCLLALGYIAEDNYEPLDFVSRSQRRCAVNDVKESAILADKYILIPAERCAFLQHPQTRAIFRRKRRSVRVVMMSHFMHLASTQLGEG